MRQRIESIIMPGPALAGLPVERGSEGDMRVGSYRMSEMAKLGEFDRLKTVLPPKNARYTVTLRNYHHHLIVIPMKSCGGTLRRRLVLVVIPDFADEPIHLHERMALYAGAEMNFGVTNGPLWALFVTPYPVVMVDCNVNAPLWQQHGIMPGTQLPWSLPGQKLVWERPTMDLLMAELERK